MSSEAIHELQQPIFAALADPVRRSLLADLAENSPRTATQLALDYPITRQGLLKHLTILEAAGLVTAQRAGREKRYRLRPEPLGEVEDWIAVIGKKWEARLERMKAFIESAQSESAQSESPES
jgi:DNA-binding transcriptional ArsR family regulator